MADEDRRSDAVLSKEFQCIGKQPAIQQQTLYFVNCKYAIGLPNLTLQRMYWSGAESLGEIVTSSLVMGENMEIETVQKRSIHPGHKIPPFTRLHQTSPNYYEEDNYSSVQKRSIHTGNKILGLHNAPFHQTSPKADDSFSPTSPATSLTSSSDLQSSPKFRDKSSLNFPPASCQTSDSLFQTPVSTPGPRSSSVQTRDLLRNKMSDINLKISTLSTYHESLLSNKQGGIFGSLLVGEPMSTPKCHLSQSTSNDPSYKWSTSNRNNQQVGGLAQNNQTEIVQTSELKLNLVDNLNNYFATATNWPEFSGQNICW